MKKKIDKESNGVVEQYQNIIFPMLNCILKSILSSYPILSQNEYFLITSKRSISMVNLCMGV